MESMEEDRFEVSDDHNHNYCAPAGGDVHSTDIRKSQLTDVTSSFPQPVPYLPGRGVRERPENRDKNHPKATGNSQLMDSDSSSDGSEVCESDVPASAAAAASGADRMSTNSTSKFRKFPSNWDCMIHIVPFRLSGVPVSLMPVSPRVAYSTHARA